MRHLYYLCHIGRGHYWNQWYAKDNSPPPAALPTQRSMRLMVLPDHRGNHNNSTHNQPEKRLPHPTMEQCSKAYLLFCFTTTQRSLQRRQPGYSYQQPIPQRLDRAALTAQFGEGRRTHRLSSQRIFPTCELPPQPPPTEIPLPRRNVLLLAQLHCLQVLETAHRSGIRHQSRESRRPRPRTRREHPLTRTPLVRQNLFPHL